MGRKQPHFDKQFNKQEKNYCSWKKIGCTKISKLQQFFFLIVNENIDVFSISIKHPRSLHLISLFKFHSKLRWISIAKLLVGCHYFKKCFLSWRIFLAYFLVHEMLKKFEKLMLYKWYLPWNKKLYIYINSLLPTVSTS